VARRSEPAFFVRVKPATIAVTGAGAAVPIQVLMSRIAQAKKDKQTILDKGPPTVEDARRIAGLDAGVSTLEKQLAFEKSASKVPAQPQPTPAPSVDLSQAILSFEYEESEKKSDLLKLTIENNDLRWFDSPIFEKGTTLIVVWGYIGHLVPPREVVVQTVKGNRTLTVECAGKGQLMNKVARTRTFNNVTRAEVVRTIAEENGFGPDAQFIDDGPPVAKPPGVFGGSTLLAAVIQAATINAGDNAERALRSIVGIISKGDTSVAPGTFATIKTIANSPGQPVVMVKQILAAANAAQASVVAASAAKAKKEAPKSPGAVPRYGAITQAGQTDAQFLKRLADLQGFEFFIDFDGLHWHPRRFEQRPMRTVTYILPPGVGDIVDFNVENDVTAKPAAITVKGVDPLTKKAFAVTADDANTPRPTLATVPELPDTVKVVDPVTGATSYKAGTVPGSGAASSDVKPSSEPNAAAAKVEASGLYTRTQQTAIELSLDLVGDPGIVCKCVLNVQGLGKRLSGRYYVSELKHKIDSGGFKQSAKCKTDGTNLRAGAAGVQPSAAQPNTGTTPTGGDGALTPKKIVDPASGETKTVYVNTAGRSDALPATKV